MGAAPSLHPTDQTLSSFGLGKLDDGPAEAVNKHLEECPACRDRVAGMSSDSFLDRVREAQKGPARSTFGQSRPGGTQGHKNASTQPPPPADTLPPGLADHPDYRIRRELGRGGMGVVYLAQNTLMGRDEVLKVMGRQLMERSGVLDRFVREIRAVARLRHPNIVTAYSATRVGESIVFAMEYVDGLDLSKLVKAKGALPVAHACNFAHQAALGLQHAHEEGLIHRDIKPANLMLARKGDKATVKVLDFGLAKLAREEKIEGGLTLEGQMLGTPDYIAPEQILDAQSADIRADIYSLGATLYYLLTGHPPFQTKSLYDLYQAHVSRDADPLNLVRPEVPSELGALVAKMMAKDPARRFQTPGEVAQALAPFFRKGSTPFKGPQTDVSHLGRMNAVRPAAGGVLSPTRPATVAGGTAVPTGKAGEPTVAEGLWENPVDLQEADRSVEATLAAGPVRRPPWVWPAVSAGVIVFGLLVAWMGGVFRVKTPDGVIVLENVPQGSAVLVDGDTVSLSWPDGGKPLEVRAVPGQRRVEVKKGGFITFTRELTVKTGKAEGITVRLEPLVATNHTPVSVGRNRESGAIETAGDGLQAGGSDAEVATGRIDLINLFDPTSGILHGKWAKENGTITCRDQWGCKAIEFPYILLGEYDFRVRFFAVGGYDALQQVCYANGHRFLWTLSGRLNRDSGFGNIKNVSYESTPTRVGTKGWVVSGNSYSSVVKVRKDGVEAYFDGRLVSRWTTDYGDMSLPDFVRSNQSATLGLVFWGQSLIITTAEVIKVGRGDARSGGAGGLPTGDSPASPALLGKPSWLHLPVGSSPVLSTPNQPASSAPRSINGPRTSSNF